MARRASLLLVLLLAGCGTGGLGESSSTADGEALFKEKCTACHTLAAAGTGGTIGPNLDAAFAAARAEGFDESTIREVVLGQMRYPIPPMYEPTDPRMFPPSEYSEEEREAAQAAIATYVASVAANQQAIAQARAQRGAEGASDPKSLFTSTCASCHTLTAAGTTGTIGPNLDQTSLDVAAIEQQIRKGGGGMPAFEGTLTDAQIQALAKYVAESRK